MYKTILVLFCLSINHFLSAHECGNYKLRAIVRNSDGNFNIIVNEGTKSEIILSTPIERAPKFLPYINRPIIAEVEITKKINGQSGAISQLTSIDFRVPNPSMGSQDTKFELISKKDCKQ